MVYWPLAELQAEEARYQPAERHLLEARSSVLALRLLGHRGPRQREAGEPLVSWEERGGRMSGFRAGRRSGGCILEP